MDTLDSRLATFNVIGASSRAQASSSRKGSGVHTTAWPPSGSSKKLPSAREMALSGFTFAPTDSAPDACTHALCGTLVTNWKAGEDPLDRLREEASECPLTKVLLSAAEAKSKKGSTVWESEDLLPNGTAMAAARRLTFGSSWPYDRKKGWKPTSVRLADAGFHYVPLEDADDNATCAYCERSLGGWEKADDPIEEHRRREPDCAFFTAQRAPVQVMDDSVHEIPEPTPVPKKTRAVSKRVVTGRGKKAPAATAVVAESEVEPEMEKPEEEQQPEHEPKTTRRGKAIRTIASRGVSEAEEEAVPPPSVVAAKRGTHSRTASRTVSRAATRGAKVAATPQDDAEVGQPQELELESEVEAEPRAEPEPEPAPVSKRSTSRAKAAPKARAVSRRAVRGRAAATDDEAEQAHPEPVPVPQDEGEGLTNNDNGTMIRHATASESEAEMDELEEPQVDEQELEQVEKTQHQQLNSESNESASRTAAAASKSATESTLGASTSHKRSASKSSKTKLAAADATEPSDVEQDSGAEAESEPVRRVGRTVSKAKPESEKEFAPASSRSASRRGVAAAAGPSSDEAPTTRTRQASAASSKRRAVAAASTEKLNNDNNEDEQVENLPPSSEAPCGPTTSSSAPSSGLGPDPFATSSSPSRLAARLEQSVVLSSTAAAAGTGAASNDGRRTMLQPLKVPNNLSVAERAMTLDEWLLAQVDKAYAELESAGSKQIDELERSIKLARAQIETTLRATTA